MQAIASRDAETSDNDLGPCDDKQVGLEARHADSEFVTLGSERMYRIDRFDSMPPFLVGLVSDSDLWMYCSSRGPVTAGRIDEMHCLFPYVTDDILHRCTGQAGPRTILRISRNSAPTEIWEPFSQFPGGESVDRRIYKSLLSNTIVFEELHHELEMTFRYRWTTCDQFGFIRTCTIENAPGARPARVDVADGLVNILPDGVELSTQQRHSCLIDAYTRCEIDPETGVGIFALTSLMNDQADPAESLAANIVWSRGLPTPTYLLGADQIPRFIETGAVDPEALLTGRRGAFLVVSTVLLDSAASVSWDIVADVSRDQTQIEDLCAMLRSDPAPLSRVRAAMSASRETLARFVANSDGMQCTGDEPTTSHHASCTLFNIMRGGVFVDNYDVDSDDYCAFVSARNIPVFRRNADFLNALPKRIDYFDLMRRIRAHAPDDTNLIRQAFEYLPLTFGRRHGDPSRPWNRFAIQVQNGDGSRVLNYQGNWRDIFQNWEALCISFPGYADAMIAKFVNASTVDGFNPYRISRDGIDWDTIDPDDPWANIGYWGDHQIVYLLKLLESARAHCPNTLEQMLTSPIFTYANVPYRIKPYSEIARDAKDTIQYDSTLEKAITARVREMGADGKLVADSDGQIVHVTLAEKLMTPILSKLSNFVPGGGIWMNTQRPEWNDANNALVGIGVSMVTLCHLRRHIAFCRDLFLSRAGEELAVSTEVADWLGGIEAVLKAHESKLASANLSDTARREILDALEAVFSLYRERVYQSGFSGKTTVSLQSFVDLCDIAIKWLDHTILSNRRDDDLYHSYNILTLTDGGEARIDRLPEMLEGQVAILTAGVLSSADVVRLVDALFASNLYRQDQESFLLYPAKELPGFLDKNIVPMEQVQSSSLLCALIAAGDRTIVARDVRGNVRFNARLKKSADLSAALDRLADNPDWMSLVATCRTGVEEAYEATFRHRAFTGRSGAMYGYEGIGCIYWHMVSKLVVAVQECYAISSRNGEPQAERIAQAYYRIRGGLGFNKSAHEFGGFPPDPHSHTPAHCGARQPGMTGQSKEDMINRFAELGVRAEGGRLSFRPSLLRRREFLTEPAQWRYFDVNGATRNMPLYPGSLAFTLCQIPVVYHLGIGPARIAAITSDGSQSTCDGDTLEQSVSSEIFRRTGRIARIDVNVPVETITLD
jgi:hypothetical protein